MTAAICPECLSGKCRNCDGIALIDDDRFVTCRCSHAENSRNEVHES